MESIRALAFIGETYHKSDVKSKMRDDLIFKLDLCGDTSDPKHQRYQIQSEIRAAMPAIWGCSKCGARNKCSVEGSEFYIELGRGFSEHVRNVIGDHSENKEILNGCIWEYSEIQTEIMELSKRQHVPNNLLKPKEINKILEEALIHYYSYRQSAKSYYEKQAADKREAQRKHTISN